MRRCASECESSRGETPNPQRRHRGLPVREDNRCRRRTERIRWGGKKVRGIGSVICWWTPKVWFSQSQDPQRKGPRPRWANNASAEGRQRAFSTPLSHLWVDAGYPRAQRQRVGRAAAWLKCRRGSPSHTQANTRKDCKDLGRGVGYKEGREIDWHKLLSASRL